MRDLRHVSGSGGEALTGTVWQRHCSAWPPCPCRPLHRIRKRALICRWATLQPQTSSMMHFCFVQQAGWPLCCWSLQSVHLRVWLCWPADNSHIANGHHQVACTCSKNWQAHGARVSLHKACHVFAGQHQRCSNRDACTSGGASASLHKACHVFAGRHQRCRRRRQVHQGAMGAGPDRPGKGACGTAPARRAWRWRPRYRPRALWRGSCPRRSRPPWPLPGLRQRTPSMRTRSTGASQSIYPEPC